MTMLMKTSTGPTVHATFCSSVRSYRLVMIDCMKTTMKMGIRMMRRLTMVNSRRTCLEAKGRLRLDEEPSTMKRELVLMVRQMPYNTVNQYHLLTSHTHVCYLEHENKQMWKLSLLLILAGVSYAVNISIEAKVSDGYYYNHMCELTFRVVSDQLQATRQIFQIISEANVLFSPVNPFLYMKGADEREDKHILPVPYCIFPITSTNFCAYLYTFPDADANFTTYLEKVNSTFNAYTFRIPHVLCSASSGQPMQVKVMMPSNQSYKIYDASLTNLVPVSQIAQINLTYMYSSVITVDSSSLEYRQTDGIQFRTENNFLLGCPFDYTIQIPISDRSFSTEWQQITITFSNIQIISINLSACSNCTLSGDKLTFPNAAFSPTNKTFLFSRFNFDDSPFNIIIPISLTFDTFGSSQVDVAVTASTGSYAQTLEGNPGTYSYELGRAKTNIYGYTMSAFSALPSQYKFGCVSQAIAVSTYANIILPLSLILLAVLVFCIRKSFYLCEKYLYVICILVDTIFKIVYYFLETDDTYRSVSTTAFIIKQSFNFVYFLQYLFLVGHSRELLRSIRRHFSLILAVLSMLLDYRFYGVVLFQLVERMNNKVRFRNEKLYVMHCLHLGLGMTLTLLEIAFFAINITTLNFPLRTFYCAWAIWMFILTALALRSTVTLTKLAKIKAKIKKIANSIPVKEQV